MARQDQECVLNTMIHKAQIRAEIGGMNKLYKSGRWTPPSHTEHITVYMGIVCDEIVAEIVKQFKTNFTALHDVFRESNETAERRAKIAKELLEISEVIKCLDDLKF